jgi:small subunit ribosomal protein S27e
MTKRENVLVPKPRSNFISIQCEKCGAKAVVFSHTTANIKCSSCGEPLATSSGSKALITGKVLGVLDQ